MTAVRWPDWWEWEIELTPHLQKRMEDRDFSEIDLRAMLEHARAHRPDVVEGRFVIQTEHKRACGKSLSNQTKWIIFWWS